jgi:hypothetical protein
LVAMPIREMHDFAAWAGKVATCEPRIQRINNGIPTAITAGALEFANVPTRLVAQ